MTTQKELEEIKKGYTNEIKNNPGTTQIIAKLSSGMNHELRAGKLTFKQYNELRDFTVSEMNKVNKELGKQKFTERDVFLFQTSTKPLLVH